MRVVFPDLYLTGAVSVLRAMAEACEQNIPFSYIWRHYA
jgi:hypothetical protein